MLSTAVAAFSSEGSKTARGRAQNDKARRERVKDLLDQSFGKKDLNSHQSRKFHLPSFRVVSSWDKEGLVDMSRTSNVLGTDG